MEMDLDKWPDYTWTVEGPLSTRVIKVPFVLTEIYKQVVMQSSDMQQYNLIMNLLSEDLPRSLERLLHRLQSTVACCLDAFLYDPFHSPDGNFDVPALQVQHLSFACDLFSLETELCRRLSHFNRLVDKDVRDYLTIAISQPRSPELQVVGNAICNRCQAFKSFQRHVGTFISFVENLVGES